MSFQCDGHVIKERRYHCCKVNGQLPLGSSCYQGHSDKPEISVLESMRVGMDICTAR